MDEQTVAHLVVNALEYILVGGIKHHRHRNGTWVSYEHTSYFPIKFAYWPNHMKPWSALFVPSNRYRDQHIGYGSTAEAAFMELRRSVFTLHDDTVEFMELLRAHSCGTLGL